MAKSVSKTKHVEFEPDAWARFERAVKVVAKSPPQHRVAKKAKSVTRKLAKTQSSKKKSRN